MGKLKRVCLIANNCFNLYNFRIEIIKKLIDDGFEVYTIANNDDYSEKLINIGCIHYPLNYNIYTYSIFSNLKTLFILYTYILKISPKVIFSFTIKPNIYSLIISIFTFKKIKLIPTISGLGTIYIKNNFKNFLVRKIFYYLLQFSYHIFFHNQSDLNLFLKLKYKSSVIPGSGVNCDKFTFTSSNFNSKNIVYIGRLIKEKGIEELYLANEILLRKNINYNLFIVGLYDNKNPNSISINLFNQLKNCKNIFMIDFTENVKKYYILSDSVILPSYREGMPRSLLEASAIGRPILGSNVEGINELIKDEHNGFLFDRYNIDAMAKTIEKFLKLKADHKAKIGINARKLVERKYSIDIVVSHYIKFANE